MDQLVKYRQIIKERLTYYAQFKPSYGDIEVETVFDETHDHYELMHVGWDDYRRIHGTILHVDIRQGQVWIQHNGLEGNIADELVELGIPREQVILGFQPPHLRLQSQFGVAV